MPASCSICSAERKPLSSRSIEDRGEHADERGAEQRQGDEQLLVRERGIDRHVALGDDPGVGLLDVLLLRRLLEAREEALIERAVGLRLALELVQLDRGIVALPGALLQIAEVLLQALLADLRDLHLLRQIADDLVDLLRDLAAHVAQLGAHVDDRGVAVAEMGRKVGLLAQHLGLLRAELADQRRGHDLGRVGVDRAVLGGILELPQPRLLLGAIGARQDELRVELAELLGRDRRALGIGDGQLVLLAIGLDRLLGGVDLVAQFIDPVAEPGIGPLRRIELRFELIDEIGIGDGVDDACGKGRIVGGIGHLDGIGALVVADDEMIEQLVDQQHQGLLLHLRRRQNGRFLRRKETGLGEPGDTLFAPSRERRQDIVVAAAQRRVEVGIAGEAELVDDLGDELARAQHVDLGADRRRLGLYAAHHRLEIDDVGLARVRAAATSPPCISASARRPARRRAA